MAQGDLLRSSPKKIYELVLSAKEAGAGLQDWLQLLIRSSMASPEHLDFLIHKVNWFAAPFSSYQAQFMQVLRIYKSRSRQAAKVAHNLVIESLTVRSCHSLALSCLVLLFQQSYDKRGIIDCLRDNYPHKLCALQLHVLYLEAMLQLCSNFTHYRTDLLEIIIEHLVHFDTQILAADPAVHTPFPNDHKIMALREETHKNELAFKCDTLLHRLLTKLLAHSQDQTVLNEILLVFQNKILPIKTTKLVQFMVLVIAERSKASANTFVSFLLSNIFNSARKENWYRIFTQSNFYLFSYIARSKKTSQSTISKILLLAIDKFSQMMAALPTIEVTQHLELKELFHKNETLLIILQTIIMLKFSLVDDKAGQVGEKYEQLVAEARQKLHFEYFLREEILERMGFSKQDNKNNIVVKYSNKFLPCTLPLTAAIVDPCMRLETDAPNTLPEDVKEFEPSRRKLHKGESISYCSDTLISNQN